MNIPSARRVGVSRWLPGAALAALVVISGLVSRPAWTGVVVSGDLTVDTGTVTTSWTGDVDIVSGSSPQTISGTLDIGGQIPATFFGLHVNGPDHWPSVPFGTLRMANECSGTGQHPCAFWYDTEPANNMFDWSAFDGWMAVLAAHPGTTAVYTFFYTPPFAADETCLDWDRAQRDAGAPACVYPGSCCPAKQDASGNMVEWQGFVSQVVTRAAGRIKSYELWNEPNIQMFWCSDTAHGCDSPTSPQKLVKMAQIAYQTIHQLDPTAVVVTPSSVINTNGPICGHSTEWLAGYLAAGGGQWTDAIAFHGYLQGCPADITPEHVQGGIRNLRALLSSYGLASKPIWDTEASPLSDITDQDELSAWLARAYLIRWSEGVQRFAFYGWDYGSDGELWHNGILPAGTAFGELYQWLVGATMTAPCTLNGTLWSCPLIRSNGGYKAIVVWKSSMDTSTTSYSAPSEYVRYQDLTGLVGNVAGPMNVGRKPILFATGPIP
jgi:hypothetical protein